MLISYVFIEILKTSETHIVSFTKCLCYFWHCFSLLLELTSILLNAYRMMNYISVHSDELCTAFGTHYYFLVLSAFHFYMKATCERVLTNALAIWCVQLGIRWRTDLMLLYCVPICCLWLVTSDLLTCVSFWFFILIHFSENVLNLSVLSSFLMIS